MWAPVVITCCVVYFVQSKEPNNIDENFGPVHIHVNTTKLPQLPHPKRWGDRRATRKAITLVDFVRRLPDLNPFERASLGTYEDKIPHLYFYGNLTFNNLKVTGINGLCLQNFEMQLAPPRIDFNLSVPRLTVEAEFHLQEKFNHFPINESGHFKLTFLELTVSGALGLQSRQKNAVYQLETAVVTVAISNVQVQMYLEHFAETFKIILKDFIMKNIEDIIIDNDVLDIIIKTINHELRKISSKKILNYLLGTSQPSVKLWEQDSRTRASRRHGK